MAQLNRNAVYLTIIDGLTTWEKLKNIRSFLEGRKQALALSELQQTLPPPSNAYDRAEYDIYQPQALDLLDDCKNEVDFLEKLEAELDIEAEKTRIKGKTDKEMYEINYFEELTQVHTLQAQSELMAVGHVSPETMKLLIRNPRSLDRCISIGLLNPEIKTLANASNINLNNYIDSNTSKYLLTKE